MLAYKVSDCSRAPGSVALRNSALHTYCGTRSWGEEINKCWGISIVTALPAVVDLGIQALHLLLGVLTCWHHNRPTVRQVAVATLFEKGCPIQPWSETLEGQSFNLQSPFFQRR